MLLHSSFAIINNSNIGHISIRLYGLHLNEHGACNLALNFFKRIRSKLNSEQAKQKLKGFTQKSVAFKGQATTQDLANLSHVTPSYTT